MKKIFRAVIVDRYKSVARKEPLRSIDLHSDKHNLITQNRIK
jgi:hypothetical protein